METELIKDTNQSLLLEEKNLLQTILDIQQDIIIVINDKSIAECNRRFFEFFGVSSIEHFYIKYQFLAKQFLSEDGFLSGFQSDVAFISLLIKNKQNKIQNTVSMFDRQKQENCIFLVDYAYFPLIESGFVITFKDITENIKYEKTLTEKNKAQKELLIEQSKLASMGEMIATIAHQWRQPINAINIIIQNLKDLSYFESIKNEDVAKATEDILRQTKFMSQTIEDFRNFLKPDKSFKEFSLIDTVSNIIAMLSNLLKSSSIEIELQYDKAYEYKTYGIKNEFGQVMLNIINNSKDAIEENKIENGKIVVDLSCSEDQILVNISDNGGGIPQRLLPDKIFENSLHDTLTPNLFK